MQNAETDHCETPLKLVVLVAAISAECGAVAMVTLQAAVDDPYT